MQIGIDFRPLNRDHLRGMGKYVSDLMTAADGTGEFHWRGFADRPDLPVHRPNVADLQLEVFETRGYRFRSWEQYGFPRRARQARVDVLHCTATTLPWWQPVPTVVTIHDTVPWQGEPNGDPRWYLRHLLPRAYRKCAAIITISENSRRDILALWPDLETKLYVIPHGIDHRYLQGITANFPDELKKLGIRAPYFVYVGGTIPRKRLDWALEVFRRLGNPEIQLAVCGVDRQSEQDIQGRLESELRERVKILPFISEESMPALFRHAVAMLYPTLYEGFGFPAVESQAVGTPVLFSRAGSLSELEGPGAHVLPTEDLDAWVQTCQRLLAQRRENPEPVEEARQWAWKFSWDESARRHLEVYESAMRRRCSKRISSMIAN